MPLYSVCSHIIESPQMPKRFQPFLIDEQQDIGKTDLSFQYSSEPIKAHQPIQVASLPDMIVWKDSILDGSYQWIYQLRNGSASISVNPDYSEATIHYPSHMGYVFNGKMGEIFGPYIQIILECKLISNGFAVLHAACVEKDGIAFAFTGHSGVGKSTRAAKWCEVLSAELISGDRPAIDVEKERVYGVPWDGKEGVYRNVCYPLAAILKVSRSDTAAVENLTENEKTQILSEQISVPMWDTALAAKSISSLRNLVKHVPVFDLHCGIDDFSTVMAYDLVTRKISE